MNMAPWSVLCLLLVALTPLARGESVNVTLRSLATRQAANEKAIRFVGIGYDLLRADPDVAGNGGVDPGYLPTRHVIQIDSGNNPAQVSAVTRYSCVSSTTTSTVYDEKSFQKKFDMAVKIGVDVSIATVDARFGLSTSYGQAKAQTTKQKTLFRERQELCNYGSARIKMGLDSIRLTTEFQGAVCRLPDSYDEGAYVRFINNWGTAFTVKVDVGKRDLYRKTEKMTSLFQTMSSKLAIGMNAAVTYDAVFASVSGSIEMNMNKLEDSQGFSESFKGKETHREIGSSTLPEPISVQINGIQTVLADKYFQGTSSSACTSDKIAQLPTIKLHLKKALDRYPTVKNVNIGASNGKVTIKLNWPKGTYGLFKPKSGCAPGWVGSGWYHWDTEDHNPSSYWTVPNNLDGSLEGNKDINLKFCIKKYPITSLTEDIDWQPGEYCLLKYRSCPTGFKLGAISFDDEDSNNGNSRGGLLPDGGFQGRNTLMHFCCRSDGNNAIPIFLPTTKPFYLLQATRYGCQAVAGMRVAVHTIRWDNEDDGNADRASGASPYDAEGGDNVKLNFCYYYV